MLKWSHATDITNMGHFLQCRRSFLTFRNLIFVGACDHAIISMTCMYALTLFLGLSIYCINHQTWTIQKFPTTQYVVTVQEKHTTSWWTRLLIVSSVATIKRVPILAVIRKGH